MNFISFFDGSSSLLEIANSLNAPSWNLYDLVDKLKSHNLINSNS
jgi:aminopeptidase-like protein